MLFESRSWSSSAARNNNKRKGAFFILPSRFSPEKEELARGEIYQQGFCSNNIVWQLLVNFFSSRSTGCRTRRSSQPLQNPIWWTDRPRLARKLVSTPWRWQQGNIRLAGLRQSSFSKGGERYIHRLTSFFLHRKTVDQIRNTRVVSIQITPGWLIIRLYGCLWEEKESNTSLTTTSKELNDILHYSLLPSSWYKIKCYVSSGNRRRVCVDWLRYQVTHSRKLGGSRGSPANHSRADDHFLSFSVDCQRIIKRCYVTRFHQSEETSSSQSRTSRFSSHLR